MRFRNSFRLLLNNFKSTYVILLFKVLTALITGALTVVILASGFEFLTESAELEAFFSALGDIPAAFFTSASFADFDILLREALENVIAALKDIILLLQGNIAGIVLSGLGLILLYLFSRFINGLALFAFGDILHDKMSQYADTPFFVGFFTNIGPAALYQLVYVPIAFLYDVLALVLCYLIFFRLLAFLSILWLLFLATTFLLVMQAIKLALISDWMPAIIVDGKSLGSAMSETFRMGRKQFAIQFSNFLMACYCIMVVNVLFAVTTFFSGLLITVPASFLFLICLQFVGYYTRRNKRYFLSYTHIYDTDNPDCGNCFCTQDKEEESEE